MWNKIKINTEGMKILHKTFLDEKLSKDLHEYVVLNSLLAEQLWEERLLRIRIKDTQNKQKEIMQKVCSSQNKTVFYFEEDGHIFELNIKLGTIKGLELNNL